MISKAESQLTEEQVEQKIEESAEEYLHRTNLTRAFTGTYIVWLRDIKRFWRDTPRRVGAFV